MRDQPANESRGDRRESDLLAQIIASPDDDGPRLVLADLLIERGDPRGELIQLQCELERVAEDDARWHRMKHRTRALLKKHTAEWTSEARELSPEIEWVFRRGFIGGLSGVEPVVTPCAGDVPRVAPLLDAADIFTFRDGIAPFVASALFPRLRSLTLRGTTKLGPFKNLSTGRLRSLRVEDGSLVRDDFGTIVTSPALHGIDSFAVVGTRLGKNAILPLAELSAPIERLTLSATNAGPALAKIIATAPGLGNLESLVIVRNGIGDDGLAEIIRAKRLSKVEELDLRNNQLSEKAIASLFEPNVVGPLRVLRLASNTVTNALLERIATWRGSRTLEKLDLGDSKITDKGVLALARSKELSNLRSLVLSQVVLKRATEQALLDSPHLAGSRLYVDTRFLARNR